MARGLDRYQASASQLQTEAAPQLRRGATTKTSVTLDARRTEFRPGSRSSSRVDRGIPQTPGDLHFRCSRGGAYVETILDARASGDAFPVTAC